MTVSPPGGILIGIAKVVMSILCFMPSAGEKISTARQN